MLEIFLEVYDKLLFVALLSILHQTHVKSSDLQQAF